MSDPADILLDHFERIAGSEHAFAYRVTPEGESPVIQAIVYDDFPEKGAQTGFTFGLSHFHPPGGGHKELMISMRSSDRAWTLACGFTAYQLAQKNFSFGCAETVNFREQISKSSRMNGFLVIHPTHIQTKDMVVDLGFRQIEIMELLPLYEEERKWILEGGDLDLFLQSRPKGDFLNPNRTEFIPPA